VTTTKGPDPEVTISLKQTEYYSATFTLTEAAALLECEPTEEAIGQALSEQDPFDIAGLGDSVLDGWDMADNSEWSIL
jgi:hypothetical protein